jgi:hypothetical protein
MSPSSSRSRCTLVGALCVVLASCGTKPTCNLDTCATGCCDSAGLCRPGQVDEACGSAGATCESCASGASCSVGICVAGPDTRPPTAVEAERDAGAPRDAGQPGDVGGESTKPDAGTHEVSDSGLVGEDGDAGPEGGSDSGVDAGPPPPAFAVVVVGPAADGGALSSASAAVTLQVREASSGALLREYSLPTVASGANHPFSLSGSSTSEGALNLSADGQFLTLAGYAAVPGVASVNGTSANASRCVARQALVGGVDTTTLVTSGYLGNNIRAAASVDGTGYWLAGTAARDAGVRYVVHGSTGETAEVNAEIQNIRVTHVFGGQLYASTQSGAAPTDTVSRVFAVGTGAPIGPAPLRHLPGVTLKTPNTFALLDLDPAVTGFDTLYVSDTTNGAGVWKYQTVDGLTWTQRAQLSVVGSAACFGVSARVVGAGVVVLCSASDGWIYRWEDTTGSGDGGVNTGTGIVFGAEGTAFRGLVFLP